METEIEPAAIMGGLYGDGSIALAQAFSPDWADRLRKDIEALFAEAQAVPGGALPRGPARYYVEVSPERIRGFVDIATHPWFVAVCESVLGPDYRIVEVGFLTAVDTLPDMGPFEIAPGTQWDDLAPHGDPMFPARDLWPRYEARMQRKLPKRGDMAARSALTIHRGTANRSTSPRPMLVVGVDAPDATNAGHHDLQVTAAYLDRLPARVRDHLTCRIVDRLTPVAQNHVIEGLMAAVA